MTDATPADGGFAASAANDDMDMTGVNPLRLNEVRRRVSVVRDYIALRAPTDQDRIDHAAALGLSVNQFLALVRAWREHGKAVAISGAGAAKGVPRPKSARNLPSASKAAAAAVIAKLGPDVSLVETVRHVKQRCGTLRVATPSRSTIWNMVMADRRTRGANGREGIVVSRCQVRLPVETDDGVAFPTLAMAVDLKTGAILAAAMGDDAATASTIVDGLECRVAGGAVLVDADLAGPIRRRSEVEFTSMKPSAARTHTARTLGRGFGSLELIFQPSRAIAPADMLRSIKDAPLSPEDARRLIGEQIGVHNAARGAASAVLSWAT
ncbi:hypothetical protein [Polymorphobacter megasporae]|uniref:hypothetical protein n=1 Tax=Glacieibacterium megasporae TaxID=2835787 RepID=UPI001C1DE364|nr:hypothetical protein [Polymorphobacter megasporae]UAJ11074.1 hypothetical protein KTC28_05015 [Polymorphobacter megasporae]